MRKDEPILVIGAGSIGERHINNMLHLGYENIHVFRQRQRPLRNVSSSNINIFTDWGKIQDIQPKVAFITTPTAQHLQQCITCLNEGMHVFVEKPLAHNLAQWGQLEAAVQQSGKALYVGYMMRFYPLLQEAFQLIKNQTLGKLISIHAHWGEYLPYWHPWEDYRETYPARKDLGGGAALTLSHDIDVALWLAQSKASEGYNLKNFNSALEVEEDVDAGANLALRFQSGVTAQVQLNYYQRPPERFYKVICDKGHLFIDFYTHQLTIKTDTETRTRKLEQFERNDMFIEQTNFFFDYIETAQEEDIQQQIAQSKQIISLCSSGHL